jgi:hypothetical protein
VAITLINSGGVLAEANSAPIGRLHSREASPALDAFAGVAQTGNKSQVGVGVPDHLRYIFDLPWCKRWENKCFRCAKHHGSISCETKLSDCGEYYRDFYCTEFSVPQECLAWRDGCNICRGNSGCTAMACPNYKPVFSCLVFKKQSGGT